MENLLDGYRAFRAKKWPDLKSHYERLAAGQTPRWLIIGCCDSRVDPATIFNTMPGELFVIRNVANLVPPFEQGPGLHGTGAAIEFAVRLLEVKRILVMGHAQCGGIAAAINQQLIARTDFLSPWIELIRPAAERCTHIQEGRAAAVERESVKVSLERLAHYSFVAEAMERGELAITGGIFGVANGVLELLDENGEFSPVI